MELNSKRRAPSSQRAHIPKVSIGMPVCNGEWFIRKALDSLLAQTFTDFELIISDNASTDATPEICKEYAKKYTRIRFIRQPQNMGTAWNFNFVLQQARGEYFMWAACDDMWESTFISDLLKILKSNHQAALSFCRFDVIDHNEKQTHIFPTPICLTEDDLFKRLLNYIVQEEYGKAIPIYGFTRRRTMMQAVTMHYKYSRFWAIDKFWLFCLLSHGSLEINQSVLFHKRYAPDPGKDLNPFLLPENRLHRAVAFLIDIYDYYAKYFHHIKSIEVLSSYQKMTLRNVLLMRGLAEYYNYSVSLLRWLLRIRQ